MKDKTVNIAGIEFKFRTSRNLMKKIWLEANSIGQSIRNLDRQREYLLKVYRDLEWKKQVAEYEKFENHNN